MLYLFWALLNIGLFIYFLIICFRVTRLLRERLGLLAASVFIFGLLSFGSNTASGANQLNTRNNFETTSWSPGAKESIANNSTFPASQLLQKTLITKLTLHLSYGRHTETGKTIVTSGYSGLTGLVSGTTWHPVACAVYPTEDADIFRYQVSGMMKWQLLGLTLVTENKNFSGEIRLNGKQG